jgi:RNA polymerase sigma-70 factor (ECF subfamily)
MNAVRESNREAFARLYDEYMPRVYRYAYYRVNDVQLAQDITSEVFEKALAGFSRYDSRKASFSTWISAIARNVIVDHYREEGRARKTSLDEAADVPAGEPGPQEEIERLEEKQLLQKCLAGLPQGEQEIIRLKFAMEMTNRDIARMTGLSESNVGVKLYRIVRKLQYSFEGIGYA